MSIFESTARQIERSHKEATNGAKNLNHQESIKEPAKVAIIEPILLNGANLFNLIAYLHSAIAIYQATLLV